MKRLSIVSAMLALAFGALYGFNLTAAQRNDPPGTGGTLNWIWSPNVAVGTAYFRGTFDIPRPMAKPTDEAILHIAADDEFIVWLNGQRVGSGEDWRTARRFDVNHLTRPGRNVIAVEVKNTGGPGGLLVRLGFIPNGMSKLAVVTDGRWRTSDKPGEDWQSASFNDKDWALATVAGPYGPTAPWNTIAWEGGGNERFTVPEGFVVETMASATPQGAQGLDPKLPFSLINMCFDGKGRLLVSQERGPVLLCTEPGPTGEYQKIAPYCTLVKGCQGMCWVDDALLLVGDGPKGTGLYRVRDTNGDDRADSAELLLGFRGGMGEHGPHAIIHGPDDMLYLVVGNHAWAKIDRLADNSPLTRWPDGQMGPDQGQPNTTEDVLLPRLNDSRGHAANIRAPGGTIWRMTKDGQETALVAAGFRNHYDACFNPMQELITYDSDMEWDEGLPWYRAPRVCVAFPGADFLWRTGAANTPDYYIDSLPPLLETPRGSPVGVECYQHTAFPEGYRGGVFLADWSAGKIFLMRAQRGSIHGGNLTDFCVGTPLNVTDLAVGPDGALYFVTGGRATEGGIFRIVHKAPQGLSMRGMMGMFAGGRTKADEAIAVPQPWSAFGRAQVKKLREEAGETWGPRLEAIAVDRGQPWQNRILALSYLQNYGPKPRIELLGGIAFNEEDDDMPLVCAHATMLLGLSKSPAARTPLVEALHDGIFLVRRRACEALLQAGFEPPIDDLWILMADQNRSVRTAARLVLQRIDPQKWLEKFASERSDYIAMEAMVALCKTNQAAKHSKVIAERLARMVPSDDLEFQLDYLRVWQLVLIHADSGELAVPAKEMLSRQGRRFPPTDERVARELAILLTHGRRVGLTDEPVHAALLDAMVREKNPAQQIHYFYCLRLLHDGWNAEEKRKLLEWYEGTKKWQGGFSFQPFLENIFRDLSPIFAAEDVTWLLRETLQMPHAASTLLKSSRQSLPVSASELVNTYEQVILANQPLREVREGLIQALARKLPAAESQAALRKIGDVDLGQAEVIALALANVPTQENVPYLLRGLASRSPVTCLACLRALRECNHKPSADDPKPFKAVLLATSRVDLDKRKVTVELLRRWTGKQFVADDADWQQELAAWGQWFAQTFPDEPPLPNAQSLTAASKWKMEDVLAFLESEGANRKPDLARGKELMTKANCYKCHKFGNEGESIGPDLTTLRSKFKRRDVLEAILLPSKVISDQYRSSVVQTKNGKIYLGLVAPQGDDLVVLQQDGTKITLKKSDVESIVASTTSAMPERLLDEMSLEEIADLLGFLESDPK